MKKRTKKILSGAATVLALSMTMSSVGFAANTESNKVGGEKLAIANVSDNLLIRSEAKGSSEVVGYVKGGAGVLIKKLGSDWSKVTSGSVTGYVKTSYLVFGEKAEELKDVYGVYGAVASWNDVKIFADHENTASVIGTMDEGEGYEILGSTDKWVEIQLKSGDKAYVPAEEVTKTLVVDTAIAIGEEEVTYTSKETAEIEPVVEAAPETEAAQSTSYEEAAPAEDTSYYAEPAADTYEEPAANYEDAAEDYEEPADEAEDYSDAADDYEEVTDEADDAEDYEEVTDDAEEAEDDYEEVTDEEVADEADEVENVTGEITDTVETEAVYEDAIEDELSEDNVVIEIEEENNDAYEVENGQVAVEETPQTEAAQTEAPQTEAPQTEAPQTEAPQTEAAVDVTATDSDFDLLAALIYCEAGNQSMEGKIAVGQVVVNRVASSSFPNSISGVIYQSGQFTPAATGQLSSVIGSIPDSCYEAAIAALNGEGSVPGALYFNSGSGQGTKIGDHQFF